MRTLHTYVAKSYLITFLLAGVVLTFVMSVGILFRISDLVAQGVDARLLFRVLLCGLPATLAFALPVSLLASSLLVFGRLSADGEITAMRASGISMWQIAETPILIALVMVGICGFIQSDLAPAARFDRRTMTRDMAKNAPVELIDEGVFMEDFPGVLLYVGRRKHHQLRQVRIYDLTNRGMKRLITAETGEVRTGKEGRGEIILDLFNGVIDPFSEESPEAAKFEKWSMTISIPDREREYRKKEKDMGFRELLHARSSLVSRFPELGPTDVAKHRMKLSVEIHKRLVMSLSCCAFVLLGIPLGVKTHRRESSIGVFLSLILVFNFYLFIIVAESLAKVPAVRPDLMVWLPVVISLILGSWLMTRAN